MAEIIAEHIEQGIYSRNVRMYVCTYVCMYVRVCHAQECHFALTCMQRTSYVTGTDKVQENSVVSFLSSMHAQCAHTHWRSAVQGIMRVRSPSFYIKFILNWNFSAWL